MTFAEIFLLAVGLSMDAFAVAVCKGLALKKVTFANVLTVGLYFGIFQALMPLFGYLLGVQFQSKIESVDHWIAFILLTLIGLSMIKEALSHDEQDTNASLGFRTMIVLAIATSIDALAVGVTFAFLQVQIIFAVVCIGLTTLIISMCGVKIGSIFGVRYKSKAEMLGGIILLLIGLKILLQHLGIWFT